MLLKRHGRFKIECTDPTYVSGIHRAWLSMDNGSIWAFGKGESPFAAVDHAFSQLTDDALSCAPDLAQLKTAWEH